MNLLQWAKRSVLAAAAAALVGCVDTAGTTVTSDGATAATEVLEASTRLKDQVRVLRVAHDEVNGLKRVHVTLASTRHARLRAEYRIVWLDAAGMELDPDAQAYRGLILEGREAVTVTGVANAPAAVSSRLRLREAGSAE